MSTTARKARKKSGEKFVRQPKVGTPVQDRAENQPMPHTHDGRLRTGITAAGKRRLTARGLEAD